MSNGGAPGKPDDCSTDRSGNSRWQLSADDARYGASITSPKRCTLKARGDNGAQYASNHNPRLSSGRLQFAMR